MGKYRKPIILLVLIALALYIGFQLYKQSNAPLPIDAIELQPSKAQYLLAVVGRVRSKSLVNVRVEFAGAITDILVDEGNIVKKGDTIAVLKSATEQTALAAANAELSARKAEVKYAQQEFDRVAQMFNKGLLAKLSLDQVQANLTTAQARQMAAQEISNQANIRVNDFSVRAPIDGIILARLVDSGQVVGVNDVIFEIGSLGPIEIEAEVDEIYAGELKLGMSAILAATGKQRKSAGHISEISPRVNPQTGARLTRLMLDESNEEFLPGRSIDINIFVRSFDNALSIERSALHKEGETWLVYVIADGKISPTKVSFNDWPGRSVVLSSGLSKGALVAIDAAVARAAIIQSRQVRVNEVAR